MANKQLFLPGEIVKKSNSIVRTRVTIREVESSRVLACLVAAIRTDDTELKETYEISTKNIFSSAGGFYYKRIKSTCQELLHAIIELEEIDPHTNDQAYVGRPFFTEVKYRNGVIKATFNPRLRPYLIELKKCFTEYNLFEYMTLPSVYSQRMFEILKSWSGLPEVLIPVADLHHMLDTPPSFQNNFAQFRRWVLEKAHKDITKKTGFDYAWEAIRIGRSVENIRFIFSANRRGITQQELDAAKAQKKRRMDSIRYLRALRCVRDKQGDCRQKTNNAIICKVCREKKIIEDYKEPKHRIAIADILKQSIEPIKKISQNYGNIPQQASLIDMLEPVSDPNGIPPFVSAHRRHIMSKYTLKDDFKPTECPEYTETMEICQKCQKHFG